MFLCQDGWFKGWGLNVTPIGAERIDKWFSDAISTEDLAIVRCVIDPFNKIVWAQYPLQSGGVQLHGYKWPLDRYCVAENAGITELVSLVTQAATIDSITDTIDSVDIAIDSRFFKGGTPIFTGFTTDNRLAIFDGAPREATLATADVGLAEPRRAFVDRVRVYGDTIDYTVRAGKRDYHGGPQTFTPDRAPSAVTGLTEIRADAYLHQFIITVEEGAEWNNFVGLEPQPTRPTGKR